MNKMGKKELLPRAAQFTHTLHDQTRFCEALNSLTWFKYRLDCELTA